MSKGVLRVYLGLAPGVGKTFKMLDEGWRRRERGSDVVIGLVETHDRPLTAAQIRDMEVVPRKVYDYRGTKIEEMDIDAVLARHPQVALVDELAHTNAPGATNEKRWQDVETLLEAGIDVITTVNIQHLESVNDVVEKITGIVQRETVPDAVVRRADQIELVDITPEALRRRMAHGNIYPADKVDASLSNFFRSGNLTALRELSLLWLADRVEDSLKKYLDDHDIQESWETRERLIVAVTGSDSDEALLRRAARMASRTGAELFAVHVIDSGALQSRSADTTLARELTVEFEGTFQEIVDEDVATALVAFARAERGTQIILGSSRDRHPLQRTGTIEKVLRQARDLDVHIIAVGGERPRRTWKRRKIGTRSWRRRVETLVFGAAALPLMTFCLSLVRSSVSLSTVFLVYLVAVLGLASLGGVLVGLISALVASGLENYYFVAPLHTLQVARPDDAVAIIAFLVFAVGASVLMNLFAQRSNEAERAKAEAEILAKAAATVATTREDLVPLLDSLRAVFAVRTVAVLERNGDEWATELLSGEEADPAQLNARFAIDDDHILVMAEASLDHQDRQLIAAFTGRVAAGLESQRLAHESAAREAVAQVDSLRSGLLRAVSHDLRTPLATIEANVSSLLASDVRWSPFEQHNFLVAADREVHRLTRLVTNLLDAGRLEAKLITPRVYNVALDDVVAGALEATDAQGRVFAIDIPEDLPLIATDPELLERVIANLVSNACRFGPPDQPVRITAGLTGQKVELLIIDRGPGIPESKRSAMMASFQHLSDERSGAGLGLSVASGMMELLGGELRFDDTPGCGLTVVLELEPGASI
jgi:two-component system sensor histidine kinase KdpD